MFIDSTCQKIQPQILNGEDWFLENGEELSIVSPAIGVFLGRTQIMCNENLEDVISAALKGMRVFNTSSIADRKLILEKLLCLMEINQEPLSHLIALEVGKPIKCASKEALKSIELVKKYSVETDLYQFNKDFAMLAYTAFNLPLYFPVEAIVKAIASGTSVTVCPSLKSPLTAEYIARLSLEAGYYALSLVNARPEQFVRLANSSCFKTDNFPSNDYDILHTALVIEDVIEQFDLDTIARKAVRLGFEFAGQNPYAIRWIFVKQNLYDEFMSVFEKAMKLMMYGDILDHTVDIGPMITVNSAKDALENIEEMIQHGFSIFSEPDSNRLLYEGWLKPTALVGIFPEESPQKSAIFAPIIYVVPCTNLFEAMRGLLNIRFEGVISLFIDTNNLDYKLATVLSGNKKIVFNELLSYTG